MCASTHVFMRVQAGASPQCECVHAWMLGTAHGVSVLTYSDAAASVALLSRTTSSCMGSERSCFHLEQGPWGGEPWVGEAWLSQCLE